MLFTKCKENKKFTHLKNKKFIQLEDGKFYYKDSIFYPVMINYCTNIRKVNNYYTIAELKDYGDPSKFESSDSSVSASLQTLKGHLELIKEFGFNTIRLVPKFGINIFESNPEISIYTDTSVTSIPLEGNEKIVYDAIEQFLDIADSFNIKVMLLLNPPIDNEIITNFTIGLLNKFKNRPTIFAYDFFNEPLYFDKSNLPYGQRSRDKKEAYQIVSGWKEMMREHAPYQLFTIGFAEPIEVFEWDPSILPVDFVQVHTYHPLRIPSELYWFNKYVKKPWIIGETSLPADNDSITYKDQQQFIKDVFKYSKDIGAIGFGWWQFQDVNWGNYEHNYSGLLASKGTIKTKKRNYTITGTIKPAAYEVNKLIKYIPVKYDKLPVNYYNMLGYSNFVLTGKVIDGETNKAIEGAVIRGWSKDWKVAANTYTNRQGIFTLYSNTEFTHFEISAPGMETKKFDYKVKKYIPVKNADVPPIKDLPNKELEYHHISFQPFLSSDTSVCKYKTFCFDPAKFHKALYKSKIETIKLEPIYLK